MKQDIDSSSPHGNWITTKGTSQTGSHVGITGLVPYHFLKSLQPTGRFDDSRWGIKHNYISFYNFFNNIDGLVQDCSISIASANGDTAVLH